MDCVEDGEADTEEVDEVGGGPSLATGLCKSSELSMRAGGGGGWVRREESADRELLFPLLVQLVLLVLLLLLELFLDGGLLGLLFLLGDLSLSIAP